MPKNAEANMTNRQAGIIFGGLLVVAGAVVLSLAILLTALAREGAPVGVIGVITGAWFLGCGLAFAGLAAAAVSARGAPAGVPRR